MVRYVRDKVLLIPRLFAICADDVFRQVLIPRDEPVIPTEAFCCPAINPFIGDKIPVIAFVTDGSIKYINDFTGEDFAQNCAIG